MQTIFFDVQMKKIRIILGLLVILSACQNKNNSTSNKAFNGKGPYMYVGEETYDVGKVNQGEKVVHIFIVENRGKADLILQSVTASCGCTIAKYDKKPIPPGKSTPIEVTFNTTGKAGTQTKTVTVVSNAIPDTKILTLHCEVVLPNKIKKE